MTTTCKTPWICLVSLLCFAACSEINLYDKEPASAPDMGSKSSVPATITRYTYEVVGAFPHDPEAFTQGLAIKGDTLYESTGHFGRSSIRKVELQSGKVSHQQDLSPTLFGEGLTLFDKKALQLTWKSGIGFIYDQETLEMLRSVAYPPEGWGIAYDGQRFIMSDGSSSLTFRDKITFEEMSRVTVRDDLGEVTRLNELEFVDGEVFANIWQEDRIARIDPASGRVTGWIDLTGLLGAEDINQDSDVLNGIAYDAARNRLFVTGKFWPLLFEIKLIELPRLPPQ